MLFIPELGFSHCSLHFSAHFPSWANFFSSAAVPHCQARALSLYCHPQPRPGRVNYPQPSPVQVSAVGLVVPCVHIACSGHGGTSSGNKGDN